MTYTVNGVCLAVSWLLIRILLFLWFFVHAWNHRAETAELRGPTILLITIVPALLFGLNVFWFTKILRGVIKLLSGQLRQVGCCSPSALPAMPAQWPSGAQTAAVSAAG